MIVKFHIKNQFYVLYIYVFYKNHKENDREHYVRGQLFRITSILFYIQYPFVSQFRSIVTPVLVHGVSHELKAALFQNMR